MSLKKYLTGLQHIGIPTMKMDESVLFYQNLGFEVIFSTLLEENRVVFLSFKDLVLELYESNEAVMASGAIDHIALNCTNIEEVFTELKNKGYEFFEERITFLPFFEKGVSYFIIYGPNREKVEFNQKM